MGRYNNKKTQAAAEKLKNTPSRARFSKGPPPRREKKKTNNDKNDTNNSKKNARGKQPNTEATSRVIDKLQSRQKQASKPRVATTEEALQHIDKSKLDEIKLPDDIVDVITNLLESLGVKETENSKISESKEASSAMDDDEGSAEAVFDEAEESVETEIEKSTRRPNRNQANSGYSEYDDDVDDEAYYKSGGGLGGGIIEETDWEGNVKRTDEHDDDDQPLADHVKNNPAFVYLTQRLSFSEQNASRACLAIEDWDIHDDNDNEEIKTAAKNSNDEAIALAMDWLCLHLTEVELTKGFQPRKNQKNQTSRPVSTVNIKVVPHPSISLAKSITSDKEWSRNVRIQQLILKYVKMGFHHFEASKVCEKIKDIESCTNAEDDTALLDLLTIVESAAGGDNRSGVSAEPLNSTDLDYAADERAQEIKVLEAIYDERLQIHSADTSGGIPRYILKITPTEDLKEPGRSDHCQLQVFPRPGYPVVEAPLLLFSNPSLPPSLLRRINDEITRKAMENIGAPVVFEVVSFLTDSIHVMQADFIKEQRHKEFEAEQMRLRKQVHGVVAQASEVEVDGGNLGRRQRAKLKAAEKAYDRGEQIQKQNKDFRQRQEERVQNVKEQNSSFRISMAEQTLKKREGERYQGEAEAAARVAMNAAFNRGESVEGARKAAEKARIASLKHNGVDQITDEGDPSETEEKSDSSQPVKESNPTPTTAALVDRSAAARNEHHNRATPTTNAFMDRLRQMYDDAAMQKVAQVSPDIDSDGGRSSGNANTEHGRDRYHLSKPEGRMQEETRVPRPVAVRSGELGDLMNDIMDQQKDQPWLVSPEARAPTLSQQSERVSKEQTQRQQEISRKLRLELERKRKAANKWAGENSGSATGQRSKKSNVFTPRQFHFMMSVRQRLPAYKMENEIVSTIKSNQITVIAGDTGCGKTTQVPQLVLDDLILRGQGANTNIIVTQPRRISAIGVSERIADERCEKIGETCGYSIKLEKKTSSRTRLLLCTTGILLRRLQCDPDLASVSHIFVDEVHERDLNTDFLIIILKDLLARRKELKLVLMSATLNSEAFSKYFGGCPVVSIPGRAHPVQEFRLEDVLEVTGHQVQEGSDFVLGKKSKSPKISKSALRQLYHPKYSKETIHSLSIVDEEKINYPLLADLLEHITLTQDEGAILVFMPGMMEIQKAIDEMYKKEFFQSSKVVIYPLHSSLSTAEQKAIFEVPPEGVRKVVVSTNIAETSITIEDVVYVVDSGRVKENRRDEVNETPTLVECWLSRASAKQRRGRAGRVRPGTAYHLFSSHTHDKSLQDYQLPEMLRVGIEDLVLQILILDLGEPTSFLSKALNPPTGLAMSNSLKLLETLGAVECRWENRLAARNGDAANEELRDKTCGDLKVSSELTALGFHLAVLPVDPRVGKMMIYGSLFGCCDPALTVAASMSSRSPFMSPFDKRDEADAARKKFAVDCSDHLTILNAVNTWKDMFRANGNRGMNSFLKENFLGRLTLTQIEHSRKQFAGNLKDIGFLPKHFKLQDLNNVENANSANTGLIKAVLCAGLYPNIIVAPRELADSSRSKKAAGEHAFRSHTKGDVYLHPSSIAFSESKLDSRYCCYHEMVKTSKTYVRDCTTVSPLALLLFGGKLDVYQTHGICSIDGWLKFRIDAKPATLVKYLRSQMERILLRKILSPEEDVVGSKEGKALISSISILFQRETEKALIPDSSGGEIVPPWTGSDGKETTTGTGGQDSNGRGGRGGRGRGRGGRNNVTGSGRGGGRNSGRGSGGRGRQGRGRQ